ncbi:uncharacterized protein LTHEOB_9440 [Lasiodiplodia theobromae]|uniref:uncharacterized protein n=1 Tax=Lasiodiplodia theobromae TaxID=45133 RepID=UPI0015C2CE8A|nr:uncharacterized protein LTHEOB_9440 [Lasiodiplodia theobromae]KAF4540344.1 hypothetical protein LTHEOB_9440 [Lasiodiplodia theobromae]
MHFFAKLVTALPAIAGVASAAVIPRDVDASTMTTDLQGLTTMSSDTDTLAKEIDATKPQSSIDVVNSLRDLIKATTKDAAAAADTQPFSDDASQQQVCNAYNTFATTQTAMLNTLTAKANDANASGLGAPIGAALRVLEGADDTYSFEIIEAVPTCADAAKADKTTLDTAMEAAVNAYS